jgi:hypothetical protein
MTIHPQPLKAWGFLVMLIKSSITEFKETVEEIIKDLESLKK